MMTTPTKRAQVYFANALLPAPLPTPPRSKMLPLLPTPCLVLLPTSKPSRADADERWDARKNAAVEEAPPSVTVPGRADAVERWDARKDAAVKAAALNVTVPNRADAVERWDARKNAAALTVTVPGRADAVERWDAHKATPAPDVTTSPSSASSASSTSPTSSRSSSSQRWNSNSNPAVSRAASAERWDAQKKQQQQQPRLPMKARDFDDDKSSTGSNDMELDKPPRRQASHAGPGSRVSPEPGMLPMPSFMVRVA